MPLASRAGSRFTYGDVLTWPEGERWELVGGEAYNMTPAPSSRHQRVAGRLFYLLEGALQGKPCVAFFASTDVVLSEADVVQPDVFVVCNPEKVTASCVRGAPDLVIEILSPATALKDRREKRALYERFRVPEYVLVDPEAAYVEQFVLGEGGAYGKGEFLGSGETLLLASLGGIALRLADVFELRDEGGRLSPGAERT